jgi:glutathione synthase/RimK-type ligase-like ATP-grasp enzyme
MLVPSVGDSSTSFGMTQSRLFRVAVQPDVLRIAAESFADRWIARLTRLGHHVLIVDAFAPGIIERLRGCDGFLWWFTPTRFPRELGKRLMQALDHAGELAIFPDARAVWHFDDKVAQHYLLEAAGVAMPRTWVFWDREAAAEFCRTAQYPLVIKLAAGFRSNNVALLRNQREAYRRIAKLFGGGVTGFRERFPFLHRGSEKHQGYLLVQELIPGNAFDTRVTVIGDRAFAFRRFNRPNDFRASGSGLVDVDPSHIAPDAVHLAFHTARTLGAASLCVDVLRRGGEPVITEVSYYYEGHRVQECPGYWKPDGGWVEGKAHPADAILDDFLVKLSR